MNAIVSRARWLLIGSGLVAGACVPARSSPSSTNDHLASSQSSAEPSDLHRCHRDEDCVVVLGNPCNPCGGCPGQSFVVMTSSELQHLIATESYCPARDYQDAATQRPQCSPCPNPPPDAAVPGIPKCSDGTCVAR